MCLCLMVYLDVFVESLPIHIDLHMNKCINCMITHMIMHVHKCSPLSQQLIQPGPHHCHLSWRAPGFALVFTVIITTIMIGTLLPTNEDSGPDRDGVFHEES